MFGVECDRGRVLDQEVHLISVLRRSRFLGAPTNPGRIHGLGQCSRVKRTSSALAEPSSLVTHISDVSPLSNATRTTGSPLSFAANSHLTPEVAAKRLSIA